MTAACRQYRDRARNYLLNIVLLALMMLGADRVLFAQAPRVIHPNGGETLASGSVVKVRWSPLESPQSDSVRIEYTLDQGVTWNTIADRVGDSSYDWQVPPITGSARLRVMQVCGTFGRADSVTMFKVGDTLAQSIYAQIDRSEKYLAVSYGRILQVRRLPSLEVIWERTFPIRLLGAPALDPTRPRIAQALGGRDNGLEVWDFEANRLLYRISDTTVSEGYRSASFSSDGQRLAVGSDRAPGLHDAATGERICRFPLQNALYVAYGPTDDEIVIGATSKQFLWNVGSQRLVDSVGTGSSFFSMNSHTPRFSVSAQDSVRVWEIPSRAYRGGYVGPGHNSGTSWLSPDGEALAIVFGSLRALFVQQVTTHRPFGQLEQWVGYIQDVQMLRRFPRIITAITGGYVILWSTERGDTSDASFSISGGSTLAQTALVEFAPVRLGQSRDSLVPGYLSNVGGGPVRIDSVVIAGSDAADFSLTASLAGVTIPPSESREIALRFSPRGVGQRAARIDVYANQGVQSGELRGVAIDTATGVQDVDASSRGSGLLTCSISPNPAVDRVAIEVSVLEPAVVSITVRDVFGAQRATSQATLPHSGGQTIWQDVSDLPSGAYLIDVGIPGERVSTLVVIQR